MRLHAPNRFASTAKKPKWSGSEAAVRIAFSLMGYKLGYYGRAKWNEAASFPWQMPA